MPLPQVAVEIVVPDAPSRGNSQGKNPVESPELRRALLQACSDTVQVAVCVSADAARHASALALIFWKTGGRVRIEVGSKDAPGGQTWTSRDIEFSQRDAPLDRWRAAGYAAGTLASLVVRGERATTPSGSAASPSTPPTGENANRPADTQPPPEPTGEKTESREAEPAPPAPKPEKRPVEERPPPEPSNADEEEEEKPVRVEPPRKPWTWSLDAAGIVGSGMGEKPRFGGLVRVSRASRGPLVTASVGYALEHTGLAGLSARWITPTIGLGYVAQLGNPFTLEARAEFVAERIEGVATDTTSDEQGRAWRWLLGGRAGAGFGWAPFESFGVLLGGSVTARGPETDIAVRSLVRGTTPILAYQVEGGLRFMVR